MEGESSFSTFGFPRLENRCSEDESRESMVNLRSFNLVMVVVPSFNLAMAVHLSCVQAN